MNIGITFDCSMGFIYKRGNELYTPPSPIQFSMKDSAAVFSHEHALQVPCVFLKKMELSNEYVPMLSHHLIKFYINTVKGRKSAGVAKFMPHFYLNQKEGSHRVNLPLENSPDPDSNAVVEFKFTRVGELDNEELMREVDKVGFGNLSQMN